MIREFPKIKIETSSSQKQIIPKWIVMFRRGDPGKPQKCSSRTKHLIEIGKKRLIKSCAILKNKFLNKGTIPSLETSLLLTSTHPGAIKSTELISRQLEIKTDDIFTWTSLDEQNFSFNYVSEMESALFKIYHQYKEQGIILVVDNEDCRLILEAFLIKFFEFKAISFMYPGGLGFGTAIIAKPFAFCFEKMNILRVL